MKKIKNILYNISDNLYRLHLKNNEIKKYKKKSRKKIYEKVKLTKKQKKAIDDIYITNYGKKIPYTWHRHFTCFTGNFDESYFPELLFIPEFERYENLYSKYINFVEDKNTLKNIADFFEIKMPKTILSCQGGIYKNSRMETIDYEDVLSLINDQGDCFIKPTIDSCSGERCLLLNIVNGFDKINNIPIGELIESYGNDFVIQEKIICHESIKKIYPLGVCTFRVITYRWKNNIEVMPAIMRIGQKGNYLDNAHAGGMFIAIDNDGSLHKKAFTEFKVEYTKHPDTGIKFDGYKIDLFPKVIQEAKRVHSVMPNLGCVNWDFTINDSGEVVLIEANLNGGSIWLIEMAHGKGAFGDRTAEILKWIRKMNSLNIEERKKYLFGKEM